LWAVLVGADVWSYGASKEYTAMPNLLAQAINCNDADRAAKIIQDALGIESDPVVNYCFPEGMAGRS
jgi:hypothetical protein